MAEERKTYAIVGTGGRAASYIDAIAGDFRDVARLGGMCDLSFIRMRHYNKRIAEKFSAGPVAMYAAADFDRMIREVKPDGVIVTSMDCTHHQYIIRAMELGCDVISEKPMTTDAAKARAIFDAIERTGRKLRVTFNYRYTAHTTKIRELVRDGVIGTPTAVDFSWVLDTSHGADYFRRWHREKDKSGGLLVHKATHHFDIINWWIGSYPETVFAMGDLKFYGRKNAEARGEQSRTSYSRYTGHPEADSDPFAMRLDSHPNLKALYLDAEEETGYIRDRNVFGDNVSAEDTMALVARYRSGVILNYSLICYSPWEGWRCAITGTKGRLEAYVRHGSHIIAGQSDQELAAAQAREAREQIKIFPMFGLPYEVEVPSATGAHGGGDRALFEHLFSPVAGADPFNRAATHIDGAASILMGISANESITSGMPVNCDELLKLPEK